MEPIFTEDIGVIILVNTEEEYLRTFRRVAELAEAQEGMHHVPGLSVTFVPGCTGGVPVQMFPSTTNPLFGDTLNQARSVRIGRLRAKFASPEHLILLYLAPFRYKDRLRIVHLLPYSNINIVRTLLERFDDEKGTLASKLQTLLATSVC
jgi:hypothetical protein